jgi:hypothetical protein
MMAEEDVLARPRVDDTEAAEQGITIGHQSALEIGGAGLVRAHMHDQDSRHLLHSAFRIRTRPRAAARPRPQGV